jgi:hypothetical protein
VRPHGPSRAAPRYLTALTQLCERPQRALAFLSLTQLAPCLLMGLVMRVEANWSALAWPPLLLLTLDERLSQPVERASRDLKRGLSVGLAFSLPLLALPLLSELLPISVGPPRDPERLSLEIQRCLELAPSADQDERAHRSSSLIVAARYQEAALLLRGHHSARLRYLNALNRRSNELERARALPLERECGYLYLGPASWLGARCEGRVEPLSATRCALPDHLSATLCLCASKEEP